MANAQLQVKFTPNRIGMQNLVHNGFKFQTKNRRGDRVYWKCCTLQREQRHMQVSTQNCSPPTSTNDLEDVWFHVIEDLEEADTNTPTLAFTDHVTYWVERNRHLWNHYQTDGPRTTNHLESWHSKLKKH
jgi:hypothetical protein